MNGSRSGLPIWRQIADTISSEISTSVYAPGQKLPTESELATRFGVNRHTVRRAVASLQDVGLLRVEQGRGTFVSDTPEAPLCVQLQLMLRHGGNGASAQEEQDEWAHLLEVRRVLEVAVAEKAARKAGTDDIAAMEAALAAMRENPGEPTGYVDADLAFHRALAAATGNPLWSALLNSLNDLLRRYREAGFRGARVVREGPLEVSRALSCVEGRVRRIGYFRNSFGE